MDSRSEGQGDRDYWNSKYDHPGFCETHEDEELLIDGDGETWCRECDYAEEIEVILRYG